MGAGRELTAFVQPNGNSAALAWLLAQPGTVIPIVGATNTRQLEQNLSCLEIGLDAEQMRRLDATSAVELGSPHAFLRKGPFKSIVYGTERELIDDRRLTVRPAIAHHLSPAEHER